MQTFVITRRLAFGQSTGSLDEPVVSVLFVGDRLKLRSLNGSVYRLFSPTGRQKTEIDHREKTIKLEEQKGSWRLHFGGSEDLHRVVSFELRRGENS
jgi:hypothetical protein